MNKFKLMVILIWSIVWLVSCVSRKKRSVTVKEINRRTGEAIAIDNLLQKYESEHQEFYKKEIREGDNYLKWPALDHKNLSIYCRKYLRCSVPSRTTDNTTGYKFETYLHYEKENIGITNGVVMVQCKVIYNLQEMSYYMTRAPTPNCIYALKRTGNSNKFIFIIINKYCDFEDKSLRNESIIKEKSVKIIKVIHPKTRQPIAKDEYLLEYELEHEKLLREEGNINKCIDWPHVMLYDNLDSYCYQYMKNVFPRKSREGVKGIRKIEKLHYQKLDTHMDIEITAISCVLSNVGKCCYYLARAYETNCAFALLRQGRHKYDPLVIIFKYCDFEDANDQKSISQYHNDFHAIVISKTEVKKENFDTVGTLHLFLDN